MKIPEQYLKDGPHDRDETCTRCGKTIKGEAVWLELDQRVNEYHDFGGIPDDKNQGGFAFGEDCARVLRKRAFAILSLLDPGIY